MNVNSVSTQQRTSRAILPPPPNIKRRSSSSPSSPSRWCAAAPSVGWSAHAGPPGRSCRRCRSRRCGRRTLTWPSWARARSAPTSCPGSPRRCRSRPAGSWTPDGRARRGGGGEGGGQEHGTDKAMVVSDSTCQVRKLAEWEMCIIQAAMKLIR